MYNMGFGPYLRIPGNKEKFLIQIKKIQTPWWQRGAKIFFLKKIFHSLWWRAQNSIFFPMDTLYPKTFFDALCEATTYVESARNDDAITKADALDGVEMRLSFMLKKVLAAPTATSYSVFRPGE
jgi:hypothetical protein